MSNELILVLGILGAVTAIVVVALMKNQVSKILPVVTLVLGLSGGGVVGKVTAEDASQSAASKVAAKSQPASRRVQSDITQIKADVGSLTTKAK